MLDKESSQIMKEQHPMAAYPNLPARYSKGTLKLRKPLRLPDGTEVRMTVVLATAKSKRRKLRRRDYTYPTRSLPPGTLARLSGIVSLGGDALADSEALYDQSDPRARSQ
jgi:predicted DNA-binding antitoxin AbrB/MazE fold protein